MKTIISIPNAPRTFDALRSLGYDINSAVADVIDNSITDKVGAKNVWIKFLYAQSDSVTCQIIDDGCGMEGTELEEAMRIGTDTSYEEGDLGKFGMGMKTASLSNCNTLTVISKKKNAQIAGYRWDISHIQNNGWSLLKLDLGEINSLLKDLTLKLGSHGTLVLWDDLFFINQEIRSYSSQKLARNFYQRVYSNLKLHLRMVYHRFLDGSLGTGNSVKLHLNNEALIPWDPFYRSEAKTEQVKLKGDLDKLWIPSYRTPIKIAAFVLPNKEGFSGEEAWKDAKGLLSWNDSQGYYIYRSNRIIRFGGWHGTKAKDEHDKLARISIDIDPSLDKLFRITVNKSKIQFPEILYQHLKNQLNPAVIKKAKVKYNKSDEKLTVNNSIRKNYQAIGRVSKELLKQNGITTHKYANNDRHSVAVSNPLGSWISNKIGDFIRHGTSNDFEIVSEDLNEDALWKIVCSPDDKFKVVVNAGHPFYTHVYRSSTNKAITDAIDALIFSLAFAELYNKNDANVQLFDTYKTICSQALQKLIAEKAI